jgi:hypothetical protein
MIVFDLECSNGHLFEGWFDSLESFEKQNSEALVSCPYCNSTNVKKVMSPVAVKKSDPVEQTPSGPIDYQRLAKEVVGYIQANFEDVGPRFSAEALKMHYGISEKKNIRGSATVEEEQTLKEEGIDFFKIALPKKDEDKDKEN